MSNLIEFPNKKRTQKSNNEFDDLEFSKEVDLFFLNQKRIQRLKLVGIYLVLGFSIVATLVIPLWISAKVEQLVKIYLLSK